MYLKSFAKINLSLNINKKLKNGLHDIQSIFCIVDLCDTISIKKLPNGRSDKIIFYGPNSKHINNKKNTISKTFKLLRKYEITKSFYLIKIHKKIPVFAGLGGGSSNAAAIFRHFLKNKIKKKLLEKFTKYIGSDFKLFFYKQGFLRNIEDVQKLQKVHKLYFLLIFPKIKCSTKEVYSKVRKFTVKKNLLQKSLSKKSRFIYHLSELKNDLQSIIEKKHPVIKKILLDISDKEGCYFSRITGSGSVCYGLFRDKKCSKVALNLLKKKYPKFWFSIAKTI